MKLNDTDQPSDTEQAWVEGFFLGVAIELLIVLVLLWLLGGVRLRAEPLKVPATLLVTGQVLDGWSTYTCFEKGYVEANPLLGRGQQNLTRVVMVKAAISAGAIAAMHWLDTHHHDGAARVIGYAGFGMGTGIAARNAVVCH